ncbi:MAG: O-antigen ligase family protein [Kiritimatiellae bacterium]|nr:O-antigen ligase family protein [Kiritimatiellia bacterium]
MLNFFVRNGLVIQIFILAAGYGWIYGGTRPNLLLPVVPWMVALMIEVTLLFPQQRSSETIGEARSRVWRELVRDPLLYTTILLTILLVIPLYNESGLPMMEVETAKWIPPKPPYPRLPFCCRAREHASQLLWFPPVLCAALAARHGLLKRGKRILLEMLCWNGAALAILGFLQRITGATSVYWGAEKYSDFFSTFGYPNVGGAYFTLLFALSAGIWFHDAGKKLMGPAVTESLSVMAEPEPITKTQRMVVPIALNFCAAIATLSRAAIILVTLILIVLGVYMVLGAWQKAQTGTKMKIVASLAAVVLFVGLGMTIFASDALKRELGTLSTNAVVERVSGRGQYHVRVARAIFNDYPVFGVGGWGYPHFQFLYMTPDEIRKMQIIGGANVHNDTVQFLAEQGVVGFGLLVVCALLTIIPAVIPIWKRYRESVKTAQPVGFPRFIYCQSPATVAVIVGTLGTVAHSLGDLPFRDPAVLLTWFLAWACSPGFIPNVKERQI